MNVYGRHEEKSALDGVLQGAREGVGGALVLWGEPGIGKTALLEYAVSAASAVCAGAGVSAGSAASPGSGASSASGFTVLSCRGTRMETSVAFAALHQLLRPVTDRIGALPPPQAGALRGALGHSGEHPERPDRFLVGAATLTLLSELATEQQPLLIAVDDAQWLDEPTAECLAFLTRRLRTEPIALLLIGGHNPLATDGPWGHVPSLELTGLDDTAAECVVRASVPGVDAATLRRTLRLAGGNPLALRELPGLADLGDLIAGEGGTAVGPRLRRAFAARVDGLAAPTRTLLLVAAAEDRGDRDTVHAAAAALGVTDTAWQEALRSGLLRGDGEGLRFRALLIRAAVYDHAPPAQRRQAHRALADVLSGGVRAEPRDRDRAEPRDRHHGEQRDRHHAELGDRHDTGPHNRHHAEPGEPHHTDPHNRHHAEPGEPHDTDPHDRHHTAPGDRLHTDPHDPHHAPPDNPHHAPPDNRHRADPDDPYRAELRAWHRAAAVEGPDGEAAALLEDCARQALRRGGCASAARALRRSADLSPTPHDQGRRLALAARAAWEAGQTDGAHDLLDRAERRTSEEVVAGISGGLRGLIEGAHGDQENAHRLLLHDLRAVADRRRAVDLACVAIRAGWSAGSRNRQAEALRVLEELAAEGDLPEATLLPLLKEWWTTDSDTPATAPLTDEAVARLGAASWQLLPPAPLAVAWGAEAALAEAYRVKLTELRRTDAAGALVRTVPQTATLDIVRGHWPDATADAAETLRIAEETGADHAAAHCRTALAWLAALRGDEPAVAGLTTRTLALSVPRGMRALTAAAYWHRGTSALFAGRADDALDHLTRLTEPDHDAAHTTFALLAAADTAEAALRAGHPEEAHAPLRTLRTWADRTGAAWAHTAADRTAALLTPDTAEAEALFQRALDAPAAATRPLCHARTQLLYGEWLRRTRRHTAARPHLAEAAETFRRLGATPLLDRALTEEELTGQEVAGGQAPPAPSRSDPLLTPQEFRVTRLAAEGLTDQEIAAHLLISPRTVRHQLSAVLPKLGIAARADLAGVDLAHAPRRKG
ncbi:AAA family ATPase [Streptomyces sp. NPDC059063]|uniref:helix-turn-helix transcriptional regulator n=1 Tax=unclassified Streptomyces TaxID=2593676 RepID=UPI003687DAC4